MGGEIIAAMASAELAGYLTTATTFTVIDDAMRDLRIDPNMDIGFAGTVVSVDGGPAETVVSNQSALDVATNNNLEADEIRVSSSAIGLLENEETGEYEQAGVLAISASSAIASVAPLLDVSLEEDLSESNPTLYSKLIDAIRPFCYSGDNLKIPVWAGFVAATGSWVTSIAKDVVDAIKGVFEEEGIGGDTSDPWVNPEGVTGTYYFSKAYVGPITGGGYITSVTGDPYVFIIEQSPGHNLTCVVSYNYNDRVVWARNAQGSYPQNYIATDSYTYNGITVYYGAPVLTYDIKFNVSLSTGTLEDALKTFIGGDAPGYYPAGTAEWKGNKIAEIPTTKPAVSGIDSTTGEAITQTMVPISIPTTLPQTPDESVPSNDPEEYPDPTSTYDPGKQVDPNIIPMPIPTAVPFPDVVINPTLNPDIARALDISLAEVESLFGPNEVPPILLAPAPSGISPTPQMPSIPLPFSSNGGLVTVYHPTAQQLYDFERWLWVTLSQASVTTVWNNPFDGVIGLFELYCTPTDIGNRNIHSGFLDSGIDSAVISRYTEIDCGTIGIPEYYGNYLDYSPYTKAHVYLPFIGIQELNPDDIVGHAVNIKYRIDEYNGSCIAMITVAKVTEVNGENVEYSNTMYQFSGNCSVDLPIAGGSQASIKAGLMQANAYQQAANISTGASLLGGLGSLLLGSLGGALSGFGSAASSFMYGQANALSNMLSGKSTVQKSGGFGSSHGALGIKNPFITVTRPKQIRVGNYSELYGYPAHKMVQVGACTGYLRCREVNVISPTATDDEKSIIEQLLKSGVYVTE